MKRLVAASLLALAASVLVADTASANYGYPFVPFGFYQPYGARYGNSISTPPYFALNPPVYYGSRYARPYGASPFASPPNVGADCGYRARPAAQFYQPPTHTPGPALMCNPYVLSKKINKTTTDSVTKVGKIQFNPFVQTEERIAKK